MGWLAHSARFLYQGHRLLGQLQRLRTSPSVEGWRRFLARLQASFVKNAFFIQEGARRFTILSDASSQGWGAVLVQGSRVIRCASGLWPASLRHHMSNALELVALCKALHTFQPWVFGGAVTAIVDNQSLLAFNNPHSLSPFPKRQMDDLLFLAPSLQFCSGPFHFWPDFLSR